MYRGAQKYKIAWGRGGKRRKLRQIVLTVPRNFDLHSSSKNIVLCKCKEIHVDKSQIHYSDIKRHLEFDFKPSSLPY